MSLGLRLSSKHAVLLFDRTKTMPGLATPLLWVLVVGLVAGAAIKRSTEAAEENESADREKRHAAGFGQFGGFREDYEENIAPNCREYPAFGVSNAMACAMTRQGDNLMYDALLGNNWNSINGQNLGCRGPGWSHYQQHCYFLSSEKETFAAADTLCKNTGGTLASIRSALEHQYVANLLAEKSVSDIYIGGYSVNGQYMWQEDGSLVANGYSNWNTNPPPPGNNFMTVTVTSQVGQIPVTAVWDADDGTQNGQIQKRNFLCKRHESDHIPGLCRWDAHRANSDTKSACMCPTNMETCNKRPNCFWYEDPRTPFKECISNAERFYNMLHRLLMRRGKKDFAIKIRYGATPARGQLPYGLYGPAIIGQGNPNPNSMYGVYGMRNPYDKRQGMGMFQQGGVYGPQTQLDAYGRPLPHTHMYGQYNYQTAGGMGAGHYGNRQNLFNQHQHMHHGHQHGYQQHQHGFQQQQQQLTPQQQRYQQQEQYQQQQRQEQQQQQQQQQQQPQPQQFGQQQFGQQSFASHFHRH